MLTALIFILFLYLIVSLRISNNNLFSPGFITSAIWLVCLLSFVFLRHQLPSLTIQFLGGLFLWTTTFFVFSSIVQQTSIHKETYHVLPSRLFRDAYFVISLCTFPLLFVFVHNVMTIETEGSLASNLRLAALGQTKSFTEPFAPFYILIWKASYLLELMFYSKKNKYRVFILGGLLISYAAVTMSKAIFMDMFVMTVCLLYLQKKIKLKQIIIGGLCLLFFLMSFQMLREVKGSSTKNDFLVLYLLSSMSAFDTLQPMSSLNWGENVFRVVYAIMEPLKISDIEPIKPLLPWITKPIQTNTYTCMYPFFKDFGYWGIALFGSFMGFIFGWLFKKVQSGNIFYIMVFAYFASALVLQYVSELFFTQLAGYVKFVFVLAVPFLASKYKFFYASTKSNS